MHRPGDCRVQALTVAYRPVAVGPVNIGRNRWTGLAGNASQLSGNAICSSCRAREAAFGCEAVVKSVIAVRQASRVSWTHDCFAAERRLAGSAAATKGVAAEIAHHGKL